MKLYYNFELVSFYTSGDMHFISKFYKIDLIEQFLFGAGEWFQDIVFGSGLNAFCLFVVVLIFFQFMVNIL